MGTRYLHDRPESEVTRHKVLSLVKYLSSTSPRHALLSSSHPNNASAWMIYRNNFSSLYHPYQLDIG